MSNSDVTLKVTQSYTFRFKFGFETPKLSFKSKFKKKYYQKISKSSSFPAVDQNLKLELQDELTSVF